MPFTHELLHEAMEEQAPRIDVEEYFSPEQRSEVFEFMFANEDGFALRAFSGFELYSRFDFVDHLAFGYDLVEYWHAHRNMLRTALDA